MWISAVTGRPRPRRNTRRCRWSATFARSSQKLDVGEPAVVGHSLGATVAAVYAAVHPARAVICVDASLRFGGFAQLVQRHANTLRSDRTMEAVLAIDHELGLEPYAGIEDIERRVLTFPREVLLGIWQSLLTTPPEQLTAIAETILPRITAPLLALHGSPPPPDYQAWLTRLVPSARLEVWDGTGHMLHLVEPQRFASRIRPRARRRPIITLLRKGEPKLPLDPVCETAGKDEQHERRRDRGRSSIRRRHAVLRARGVGCFPHRTRISLVPSRLSVAR